MTICQKQRQLYFLGYYKGDIDGKWGVKSKAATTTFQEDFELEADGIFGAKTEAKTIEIIKIIQREIGTYEDGIAGSETATAMRVWQKKHDLKADGIAGESVRAKIGIGTVDFWETIKYFKKDEFKCKCGGKHCNGFPVEINHTVVKLAERARKHFGKPCTISSGVRCVTHNKNVGGVTNSRHTLGKAVDFSIKGVKASKIFEWTMKQPEVRYSYCIDTFYVHMDVK